MVEEGKVEPLEYRRQGEKESNFECGKKEQKKKGRETGQSLLGISGGGGELGGRYRDRGVEGWHENRKNKASGSIQELKTDPSMASEREKRRSVNVYGLEPVNLLPERGGS